MNGYVLVTTDTGTEFVRALDQVRGLPVQRNVFVSDTGEEANRRRALEQLDLRGAALESLAFEVEARTQFMRYIEVCRRAKRLKITNKGLSVAQSLASVAQLQAGGNLQVREPLTAMAFDIDVDYDTIKSWIEKFEQVGLLRIQERGTCKGHPYCLEIIIRPEEFHKIKDRSARTIERHLAIHKPVAD